MRLILVVIAAYCAFILSLPLFPTQDGPMHLYYARIIQALVLHQDPGLFPHFFTVKHLLPPYATYYYLLVALGRVVSLVQADKLVVCLYVFLFLTGMRSLCRTLGPNGDTFALLAAPLVLNWPLGMGFINFCLSLALAPWAVVLWLRPTTAARRIGFVVLCGLMMLTHPVPLLLVLGFAAIDLLIHPDRSRLVTFVPACLTLLYLRAFTAADLTRQLNQSYLASLQVNALAILTAHSLTPFSFKYRLGLVYWCGLASILLLTGLLGLANLRRSRAWTPANTFAVLSLALLLVLPLLPPDLNHSHFFSARLVIVVWMTAIAGASATPLSRFAAALLNTTALGLTGVALTLAVLSITPVARQLAQAETIPIPDPGRIVLLVHDADYEHPNFPLTYDPYLWSGTRLVRRGNSVLYNTPWLDLDIIPIGARSTLPTASVPPLLLEWPDGLRAHLLTDPSLQAQLLPAIDTLLIDHGITTPSLMPDPILGLAPARAWICTEASIYTLCSARQRLCSGLATDSNDCPAASTPKMDSHSAAPHINNAPRP